MKIKDYKQLHGYYEIELENEDDLQVISKMLFKTYGHNTVEEFKNDLRKTKVNTYKKIILHEKYDYQSFQKIKKLIRIQKMKKIL